ncbi:MAG: hypothetical protein GY913_28625 [Proteobacteria bacterium]|nr:hypothetical protein [Pseudomonadota bacterium]
MSDKTPIQEIEGLLQAELEEVRATNSRSTMIGGTIAGIVGLYLLWAGSQIGQLLDPEGLGLAATGVAVEAVPQVGDSIRSVVVRGAPDLATSASQAIVEMIPTYRQLAEDELAPVIDEVAVLLATTAVDSVVAAADHEHPEYATQAALQDGASAVVDRLDALLQEALDSPDNSEGPDGPTPRDAIVASLEQLETIDKGLARLASGGGDAQERELLVAWLNVVSQFNDDLDASAVETVRAEGVPE